MEPNELPLVHAVLIATALTLGTVILVLGIRGFLTDRRARARDHRLTAAQ